VAVYPGSSAPALTSSPAAPPSTASLAPLRPRTRLQDGIRKAKVYTDGTVCYGFSAITGEPRSVEEALTNPHWKKAMDLEYDALMKNKHGTLFLQKKVEMS
jgi:hypothetical protein